MLYYEAHVTIEPVFDDQLDKATQIARNHHFKIANLLMQKRALDTPERSQHDTFMTGHGQDSMLLQTKMVDLIRELQLNNYKVWRYKIEKVTLDSRYGDDLELLQ